MMTETNNNSKIDTLTDEVLALLTAKGLTAEEAAEVLTCAGYKINNRLLIHVDDRKKMPLGRLLTE